MIRFPVLVLLAWLAAGAPARAFDLALPIACEPGRDCWFVNFVDRDPGPGVRDWGCGAHGYDGHKGTDIAIPDRAAMARGVDVLAAAAGVVAGVRGTMPDGAYQARGRAAVAGQECGNGVTLRHADGWETQYCHMAPGNLRVAVGDTVAQGDVLGRVGLSGLTEFPHVHLTVRKDGVVVDPFLGLNPGPAACGVGPAPLWRAEVLAAAPYPPSAMFATGFAAGPVDMAMIDADARGPDALSTTVPALVVFGAAYWVEAGDRLRLVITAPDGATLIDHTADLTRNQARRFAFAGKKRPGAAWPAGAYRGRAELIRNGAVIGRLERSVVLAP